MKDISSTQNETFKQLKQLATGSKYRKRDNQTLLEGIHLCQSYLEQVGQPLICVYSNSASYNPEAAALIEACNKQSTHRVLISDHNFKALSTVENGIGIIFVITIPVSSSVTSLEKNALLLQDIQDPGNMGTILRTAAAAGVTEIFSSTGSTSAWSPKTLRAGMGAHFNLTIHENIELADVISNAKVPILATSLDATDSVYDKDLSKPTAWLLGNEGQGISKDLLALNVEKVIIPQNPNVESLNVAAATAVCLFEQVRQTNINGVASLNKASK